MEDSIGASEVKVNFTTMDQPDALTLSTGATQMIQINDIIVGNMICPTELIRVKVYGIGSQTTARGPDQALQCPLSGPPPSPPS